MMHETRIGLALSLASSVLFACGESPTAAPAGTSGDAGATEAETAGFDPSGDEQTTERPTSASSAAEDGTEGVDDTEGSTGSDDTEGTTGTDDTEGTTGIDDTEGTTGTDDAGSSTGSENMCGNGSIDGTEICDGADLGGQDCVALGGQFTGGSLACAASCDGFIIAGCTFCGDSICDDAAGESLLTCPVDCTCGDGHCDQVFESSSDCPADCYCGDGVCEANENELTCLVDCSCGDGVCDPELGETTVTCSSDCTAVPCGDGVCDLAFEGFACPADCPAVCGDGVCAPWVELCPFDCFFASPACGDMICNGTLEFASSCPVDCWCGDGLCDVSESPDTCPADCLLLCGNGLCEPAAAETVISCPSDCTCGDATCDPWDAESSASCPADCFCGNGACEAWDDESLATCPLDCALACGDGVCDLFSGSESSFSCPADCFCGDGVCEQNEAVMGCAADCS